MFLELTTTSCMRSPIENSYCKLCIMFAAVCMSLVSCWPVKQESDLKDLIVDPVDESRGDISSALLEFIEAWDDWGIRKVALDVLKLAPIYKTGRSSLDPDDSKLYRELMEQVGKVIHKRLNIWNELYGR